MSPSSCWWHGSWSATSYMELTPCYGPETTMSIFLPGAISVRCAVSLIGTSTLTPNGIVTRVLLAAQVALPGCALALSRKLRQCAIGQEVTQRAHTYMQDLTFCLIIPLAYILLRKLRHHLLLYLTFTDIHVRHHCATPSFRYHRRLRMLGLYLYVICFLNHHLGSASHHL